MNKTTGNYTNGAHIPHTRCVADEMHSNVRFPATTIAPISIRIYFFARFSITFVDSFFIV